MPRTSVWRVSDQSLVWGADADEVTNSRLAFVAFSPDGTLLVSVNEKAPVTADWWPVAAIDGSFTALSFSPDGKRLAVADAMGAIHFFCPG